MSESDKMQRAVRWIVETIKDDPTKTALGLLDQAAQRFDLTPRESEELLTFYREAKKREQGQN